MNFSKNIQEIIQYIIKFLLRTENDDIAKLIGYTSDVQEFNKYKIVIIPSRFFEDDFYGTKESLPILPLETINGEVKIPILYGNSKIEQINNTTIIHADIIASTYFLISRYEEIIRPEVRDQHGRFIGKESIAYKAGFLNIPIVEKYGKILRNILRENGVDIVEPKQEIEKIYLTHDIDYLAHYKNIRSVSGVILRFYKSPKKSFTALKTYFGNVKSDPWFTFPWLLSLAEKIKNVDVKTLVFIKDGIGNLLEDKPIQNIKNKSYNTFFRFCDENNVEIGLHPSYQAGINPNLITEEKALLEKTTKKNVTSSRNHYLCNREPRDFNVLIENSFTDDFTMCFADIAGFRLGTCRAVRWIDPEKQKFTSLILHPLTIMDVTLNNYMHLNVGEAYDYCKKIVNEVKNYNGELVLLWHNNTVEENNGQYYRMLYEKILNYIR